MGIFGGKNPLKQAEKSIKGSIKNPKKYFKKMMEGSITTGGIPGGHTAKAERWIGRKLFDEEGKIKEGQKYTLGSGTKRQSEKDIAAGKAYINPEEPTLSPDPRIAEEQKLEAARRRNRNFGRAMLMTSRRKTLGT